MLNVLPKEEQINSIFTSIERLIPSNTLLSCPDWAEQRRYMNSKITGRSGAFSFTNAPYCREICDCFSKNNPTQEVAIMKGVQLGLTTSVIENTIGYNMDINPSPMMFVFPNKDECKSYKNTKIDNLIDNSDLRSKIVAETENRNTRRTGDTTFLIEFAGGFLKLASAGNAKELRSTAIKILFLDELDAYVEMLKNEGSPVEIAVKRTDSYILIGRKICYNSTPLLAHKSKIFEYYKKGDQRKFYVPCPICGEMQELVFYKEDGGLYGDDKALIKGETRTKPFGLLFDIAECKEGNFESVRYRCMHCGNDFKDYHKQVILQKGEWRATAKAKVPNYRSYHISALYSLTKPWRNIVLDFIEAGSDPKKLQSFYNLDLGLPFEDRTGGVEYQTVHRLKDDSKNNIVPKEALFLTCVADVQRDRIECEIKAWGDRLRCWGIDHRVLRGNTSDKYDQCWKDFVSIKDEYFVTNEDKPEEDKRQVDLMLVDSGDGENTDVIYDVCETFGDGLIMPLKGLATTTRTKEKFKITELPNYENLSLVEVYVDLYKNSLARYLAQEERIDGVYPDNWFSFARGYSDEYFRQLTTEKRVKVVTPSGIVRIKWEAHGRNEAWDLNVYSLLAIDVILLQYSILYLGYETANPREVIEYVKTIRGIK